MTRLLTDGAEFGDGLFFELNPPNVYTSPVRSGVYCYGVQSFAGPPAVKLLPSHISEFYFRFCSYISWVGDQACNLCYFTHVGTQVVGLYLDTSGKLNFTVGGSIVATGIYPFVDSYWHLIDMHIAIGTSGSLQCKLDGVMDMDYSGNTRGNSETQVDRVYFDSGFHLGFYPTHYFDDIAMNDLNGSDDNTWCGDGHVELLRPNAEGSLDEWTPSSGSVHYAMVDDFPPNGDTDYVGTILPNKQELFNLSAFDDTNKLVRRVYSEMRARDMSAVGQVLKLGVKTSGSTYLCAADRVLTYNYLCVKGDEMLVNPATGSAWDKTALDALQFVVNSENIIG